MSSTVARPAQKPVYKDYVSFLENYKNGNSSASQSTTSEDVVDHSTTKFQSYNEYLNNLKNKKFNPVKPQFVDNNGQKNPTNRTMKSEIFIEIQEPDNRRIEKKINVFENESVPNATKNLPPTVIKKEPIGNSTIPPPPPITIKKHEIGNSLPPPPPPPITIKKQELGNSLPPSPPPLPPTIQIQQPLKFSTLPRSGNLPPPTNTTINSNKTPLSNQRSVDKNDPRIRKLVNGALRDLYGAYHGRANDIVATLPRSMVKKNNNIQNIINDIALKGDLDKLNGRVNPKSEQE